MTYRGHTVVGGIVAVCGWEVKPPEMLAAALVTRAVLGLVIMIGALAPDLDLPQPYLSRRLLGPLRIVVVLLKWSISNPVTWLLFGRMPARRPATGLVGAHLAWWWLTLPLRWMAKGRQRIVWIVRHRGFSHSLLGVGLAAWTLGAIVAVGTAALAPWLSATTLIPACCGASRTLPVVAFATEVALAFGVGCLSHLFADALTVSGVPLLLPWTDRRFAIGPRFLRLRSN